MLPPDIPMDDHRLPSDAQTEAVRRLGIRIEALSINQARFVLAARDYADEIMSREPREYRMWHTPAARQALIQFLFQQGDERTFLMDWALENMNEDLKRLPRIKLTRDAKAFLRALTARRKAEHR